MTSVLSFKLEETDDEYIIVNCEEEDICSESIQQQEDTCEPQLGDEEIVNFEDAYLEIIQHEDTCEPQLGDEEIVNFEDAYLEITQQHEDTCEPQLDDEEIVNFKDSWSESIQQWEDKCKLQLDDEKILDLATHESLKHFAISRKYLTLRKDYNIEDIVKEHVLTFLPAKSLYKCRAVSKEWERWISSPFFIHQHTLRFKDVSGLFCQLPGSEPSFISLDPSTFGVCNPTLSFLPERVDIRATCNGLLCCQGRLDNQAYYICNPVTEEWKMLPEPSLYHASGTGIALVFEPSTFNFGSHYELIAAVQFPDTSVLFFEIYSSRTNSWRISETVCCEINDGRTNGDGFYMRGYAYWEMQSGFALAFNVIHEQYGIIKLPHCRAPVGTLTEMDGCLCYLFPRVHYNNNINIEVYGTMEMRLTHGIPIGSDAGSDLYLDDGLCRAVCFVNDDLLIIELGGKIIAYNVKERKSQWLSCGRTKEFSKYLPYVNSLVTVASPVAKEMD